MSKEIARQWLQASAETANKRDLSAHMGLISKQVSLTGVPGFDNIGYADWQAQCKHEFEHNVLSNVRYDGIKILAETATSIMFKTYETVEATDGTVNAQGIEVLLKKENDGIWRLFQERVLSDDEARHDRLI